MRLTPILLSCLLPLLSTATARAADYNADGYDDLLVGVPDEDGGAGIVHALYGSSGGIAATSSELWHQDISGICGTKAPGDVFGGALAAGDFDGDGADDAAIGVEADAEHSDAGSVSVVYGDATAGLDSLGDECYSQVSLSATSSADDLFGDALAVGDFNGDGYDDLVVAASKDDETVTDAGQIYVIYSDGLGLSSSGTEDFGQAVGSTGTREALDWFGHSMVAGDFDADGYDDLLVGAPREDDDLSGEVDAGALTVIFGSSSGLDELSAEYWTQDTTSSPAVVDELDGEVEADDLFGNAMVACDLDGDGYDDVAVGARGEDVAGVAGAGKVWVAYGYYYGLDLSTDELISQNKSGILDTAETDDSFGEALACADFSGDGYDDLAIGVPGEVVGGFASAGGVAVIYGSSAGLDVSTDQLITQDSSVNGAIADSAEADDEFGASLAAGDYDGDGCMDLAIGAPGETTGAATHNGQVHILYGCDAAVSGRLSGARDTRWHQDTAGIANAAENDDRFGTTLR